LRRDRREQLALLRQPDGDPVPQAAQIRIERLLDRLELTLRQIKEIEAARDAGGRRLGGTHDPLARGHAGHRSRTRDTSRARGFLAADFQSARTRLLCRTCGTPFSSGGSEREQGIGKDGNRRVRAAMVELAWLWLRWQPDSTLSA
jgi:transposase